jgi:UDP-N-acetylmuramate--alanine ligase
VQNALAAAALCTEIGLSSQEVISGLRSFPGIRRRFEFMGEWNGITLINDYAHHPTAVRATLKTARDVFGARRVWCVFQPHQLSRTQALMDEFAASFDQADEVLITPVFAAREQVTDDHVRAAQELARRIAVRGRSVRFIQSLDRIVATIDDAVHPGEALIAMGAGDIERILFRRDGG